MLTFTDNPVYKLVPDLPFREYAAAPGINNTSLSWFDEWSGGAPAKYRFYVEHPELRPEPTDAQFDGSCYHQFVLQPDCFDKFYVVRTAEIEEACYAAALAGKSKAKGFSPLLSTYKDWAAAQEAEGRQVITQKRADELHWMRDALLRNECVRDEGIFEPGTQMEVSAFCGYKFKSGPCEGRWLQLKMRFDLVNTGDALVDLKSARTAHQAEFSRQCFKLRYHRQAALYIDGANANGLEKKRFGFLAQDKFPPYLACIHWVNFWLPGGRLEYQNTLSRIGSAILANSWPGYGSGELEPPEYAKAELEAAA